MLVPVVWLGAIILLRLVGEAFSLAGTDRRAPRPDVERPRGPYADEDGSMRERFAERLMAFEASTGMPHDIVVLLAAPFVILGALRWHVFRLRTGPRQTSSGCIKGAVEEDCRLSRTDDGKHALRRAGRPPHPDVMDASRTPKVFLVGVLFFVIAAVLLRPVDPTRRDGDERP